MEIEKILEEGAAHFLPNLSIDLVIIGYKQGKLQCLLLKFEKKWVLPGGYVKKEESVDEAVVRILKERTGLEEPHFKFLAVFGDANRRFSEEFKQYFKKYNLPWKDDYFINNRFVTLAHYSLVDIDNTHPTASGFDEAVAWFPFEELPELWLDHRDIVNTARNRLKTDIKREQLSYNLLPDPFTMPELHRLHQTILDEHLDRSRFQKKMLATGLFERLPKLKKETPGSNPYQYRLKQNI
ncbi:NUDIX domain-containing protein [Flavobacteriaceae bacterium GF1]